MTQDATAEEPKKGAARIILIDGLLIRGGFFALWMIVGGFCIDWFFGRTTSFVEYVSSRATWTYFAFFLFVFGLFIGLDMWFRQKGAKAERYKIT